MFGVGNRSDKYEIVNLFHQAVHLIGEITEKRYTQIMSCLAGPIVFP